MFAPRIGFGFIGIFGDILAGFVFIIAFVVVVGVLFLLVRFLLKATQAAELYIANNQRKDAPAATPPAATTPPVATKATPTRASAAKPPATKPPTSQP